MKMLKDTSWDDESWRCFARLLEYNFEVYDYKAAHIFSDSYIQDILDLMEKQKSTTTVYEAYLKAVEIKSSSFPENNCDGIKKRLMYCIKKEEKLFSKDTYSHELRDYINALKNGYNAWLQTL